MTYPKAIVISAALLAAAIAFAAYQPAQSALGSGGRYMLGPIAGDNGVFVIDNETGEVRVCGVSKGKATCVTIQKKW